MIRVAELEAKKIDDKEYLVYWCREKDVMDSAELQMLRQNQIEGVLPFTEMRLKGNTCYCYDVAGTMSLEEYIGAAKEPAKLEALIEAMRTVLSQADAYMLYLQHYVGMAQMVRVRDEKPFFMVLPVSNYDGEQIEADSLYAMVQDKITQLKNPAAKEETENKKEEAPKSKVMFCIRQKSLRKTIQIDKPVFRLGRDGHQVDYMVKNPVVGRLHASLHVEDGRLYIVDETSKNGTYIAGKRLESGQKTELHQGDEFRLGTEEFEML